MASNLPSSSLISSFPATIRGLGGFWEVLGCEMHPESILLLPLFKAHLKSKGLLTASFGFQASVWLKPGLSMVDKCWGSSATLPFSAIHCRPTSAPQTPKTRKVYPSLSSFLHSICPEAQDPLLPVASSVLLNWSNSDPFFKASVHFWFLLKTTPLMVVSGTLLMNTDTIFLCASYHLHPIRGCFPPPTPPSVI